MHKHHCWNPVYNVSTYLCRKTGIESKVHCILQYAVSNLSHQYEQYNISAFNQAVTFPAVTAIYSLFQPLLCLAPYGWSSRFNLPRHMDPTDQHKGFWQMPFINLKKEKKSLKVWKVWSLVDIQWIHLLVVKLQWLSGNQIDFFFFLWVFHSSFRIEGFNYVFIYFLQYCLYCNIEIVCLSSGGTQQRPSTIQGRQSALTFLWIFHS